MKILYITEILYFYIWKFYILLNNILSFNFLHDSQTTNCLVRKIKVNKSLMYHSHKKKKKKERINRRHKSTDKLLLGASIWSLHLSRVIDLHIF